MPDWATLIPEDLTVVQAILWITAFLLLVGVIVKLWPFVSNAVKIVDALLRLPALLDRMESVEEKIDSIHHETHNNDGSSIKDAVGRIEVTLGELGRADQELRDQMRKA